MRKYIIVLLHEIVDHNLNHSQAIVYSACKEFDTQKISLKEMYYFFEESIKMDTLYRILKKLHSKKLIKLIPPEKSKNNE